MLKVTQIERRWFQPPKSVSPELEAAAHCRCTCREGVRQLEGVVPKRFMFSEDDDTQFRSKCERKCICVLWHDFSKKKMNKNLTKSPGKKKSRARPTPQMPGCSRVCSP